MLINPHPPLSAFPVAFIVVVFVLESLQILQSKEWLAVAIRVNLWIAFIGVITAFYSGYYASHNAQATFTVPEEAIAFHHNIGRMLLFSVFPLLGLKLASEKARFNQRFWEWLYRL